MYRSSTIRSRSYSPPPTRSRSRPTSRRNPDSPSHALASTPLPPPPPISPRTRHGTGRSNRRSRAYPSAHGDDVDDYSPPRRKREVTIRLCVYRSSSHNWHTAPMTFKPDRINDVELWEDIRYVFHTQLQNPWVRIFGFNRVKSIVPIAFTQALVPIRTDPKDFPEARQLVHAYHHPDSVRPDHRWVDYLTQFDASDTRQNGLEFIEGLWAEKLGALAVIASVAIIIVCIVWCVRGGVLQTVFTVMGFVLSFVAAEIALVALYYQISQSGSPGS